MLALEFTADLDGFLTACRSMERGDGAILVIVIIENKKPRSSWTTMLFIFHDNVIRKVAFEPFYDCNKQQEWTQSRAWKSRGIPLHIIGFHLLNTKHGTYSGHLNLE
jgi:hypothetical protein